MSWFTNILQRMIHKLEKQIKIKDGNARKEITDTIKQLDFFCADYRIETTEILYALALYQRWIDTLSSGEQISVANIKNMMIAALIIGIEYHSDTISIASIYASDNHMSISELNSLRIEFVKKLGFNLSLREDVLIGTLKEHGRKTDIDEFTQYLLAQPFTDAGSLFIDQLNILLEQNNLPSVSNYKIDTLQTSLDTGLEYLKNKHHTESEKKKYLNSFLDDMQKNKIIPALYLPTLFKLISSFPMNQRCKILDDLKVIKLVRAGFNYKNLALLLNLLPTHAWRAVLHFQYKQINFLKFFANISELQDFLHLLDNDTRRVIFISHLHDMVLLELLYLSDEWLPYYQSAAYDQQLQRCFQLFLDRTNTVKRLASIRDNFAKKVSTEYVELSDTFLEQFNTLLTEHAIAPLPKDITNVYLDSYINKKKDIAISVTTNKDATDAKKEKAIQSFIDTDMAEQAIYPRDYIDSLLKILSTLTPAQCVKMLDNHKIKWALECGLTFRTLPEFLYFYPIKEWKLLGMKLKIDSIFKLDDMELLFEMHEFLVKLKRDQDKIEFIDALPITFLKRLFQTASIEALENIFIHINAVYEPAICRALLLGTTRIYLDQYAANETRGNTHTTPLHTQPVTVIKQLYNAIKRNHNLKPIQDQIDKMEGAHAKVVQLIAHTYHCIHEREILPHKHVTLTA